MDEREMLGGGWCSCFETGSCFLYLELKPEHMLDALEGYLVEPVLMPRKMNYRTLLFVRAQLNHSLSDPYMKHRKLTS